MGLSNVTILITTFLRDGCMIECVRRIQRMMPDAKIIVVDDGRPSARKGDLADELVNTGHDYIMLPFDSGLPAKRNAGMKACQTRYLLMGCDDFDFCTLDALLGVQKLQTVLDLHLEVDVASGRRGNEPYEGFLSIVPGQYIKETRLHPEGKKEFYKVDLTVNYFLARIDVIRQFPWDERMKIGGEHGDWFLDLKDAGRVVVWVPGVNITEFQVLGGTDPEYDRFRGRAVELGHKIFLEKRGVVTYKGFDDPA